ncbi:MAG TPA: glycine--tRNA ligase subunit beta, partial [bacterium]|nr:glycine--tRNA ligase subunit beta [bacterium]HEX67585.1 glycine--tRNA ligase subunit beta [bacterium]
MKNFLLEIGTEPLPYQEVSNLLLQLKNRFISLLEEKKVGFSDLKVLGTLRRLTLFISSIPEKTPDEEKVILGPPWEVAFNQIGDPLLPALRFAGRLGYKAKDLIKVSTDKGVYAGLKVRKEGKEVKKILEEEIPRIISSLKLRQSMKWGEGRGPFVRPIRWILALIGEEVVKFKIFGLESSNYTHGHLLYAENRKVEIGKADLEEYKKILREYFVIVDPREREETIGSKIEELLKGEKPVLVEKVKERNTWSLEYPVPFKCSFPSNFLSLPREVIIACLVEHQNYIPLEMDKKLSSCFVVVGEGINENLTSVKEGHERVVKARLSDAEFFWKEDLKIPLQARVESLKQLSFHENLGSYYEKVSRLKKIAKKFAEILNLPEEEKDKLFRATFLSKADLLTHMVQEFPSLQGIMGGKYALAQGEDRDVAQAIEDQYLPFAEWKSGLPKNRIGVILALSDRLDTLGGYTASDMLPTGSSDPYGL